MRKMRAVLRFQDKRMLFCKIPYSPKPAKHVEAKLNPRPVRFRYVRTFRCYQPNGKWIRYVIYEEVVNASSPSGQIPVRGMEADQ